MDIHKYQGDKNPVGRPRGHGISWYLSRIGEETSAENKNKKEFLARRLFDIALDPGTSTKDVINLASEIMDRLEGKPVNMNLNADIESNPFDGIPTEKIEALKVKLEELRK